MFQILTMDTDGPTLRSEAYGWDAESPLIARRDIESRITHRVTANDVPVGLLGFPKTPNYPSPLHAMADGWELMTPPSKSPETGEYIWWFKKEDDNRV